MLQDTSICMHIFVERPDSKEDLRVFSISSLRTQNRASTFPCARSVLVGLWCPAVFLTKRWQGLRPALLSSGCSWEYWSHQEEKAITQTLTCVHVTPITCLARVYLVSCLAQWAINVTSLPESKLCHHSMQRKIRIPKRWLHFTYSAVLVNV